jgi:hypothetical protein
MDSAGCGYPDPNPLRRRREMPNMDAIANVIVLAAAGVGAILAVVCAVELLRHRGSNAAGGLTSRGDW